MNLYQVNTNHYAPKDSHKAIWAYVIAESNESLYEWLKSEPTHKNDVDRLYLSWADIENNEYGEEEDAECQKFKQDMITLCDFEETSFANYDDLYYGKTFVSWDLVKENFDMNNLEIIKNCGIRILNVMDYKAEE